jgi:hypothetical protein
MEVGEQRALWKNRREHGYDRVRRTRHNYRELVRELIESFALGS